MNYINIRKVHYKTQRKLTREANADMDDWLYSPYNAFKSRLIIELSARKTLVPLGHTTPLQSLDWVVLHSIIRR